MRKDTQISMRINSELLQKIQEYAKINHWSISQAISVILEEYFTKKGETP